MDVKTRRKALAFLLVLIYFKKIINKRRSLSFNVELLYDGVKKPGGDR